MASPTLIPTATPADPANPVRIAAARVSGPTAGDVEFSDDQAALSRLDEANPDELEAIVSGLSVREVAGLISQAGTIAREHQRRADRAERIAGAVEGIVRSRLSDATGSPEVAASPALRALVH